MRRFRLLLLICLLLLLLPGMGCRKNAPPPNIVLISIDSLRADHLGAYGYGPPTSPRLDRLAAEGVVFDHAFSTTSWTLPAHAAMFTATDNFSHTLLDGNSRLPEGIPTLAGVLGEHGYFTFGFYSGPYLHPGFGLGRGFQEYHDCTSFGLPANDRKPSPQAHLAAHVDVTNPILLRRITARVKRGVRQPFFLFIHFWDVHYDYIPPARYVQMLDPGYRGHFTGHNIQINKDFAPGMDRRDFEHIVALYDGEIRYTDDTIAAILEEMDREHLLENTAVIVTADHGEEFLEHGGKGHGRTLYDEVIHVPLILWYPRRLSATRKSDLVSIIDIGPTALDLAGIRSGLATTGRSLLSVPAAERGLLLELQFPLFHLEKSGLRTATQKVIHDLRRERARVYRLDRDAAEKQPEAVGPGASAAAQGLYARLQRAVRKARTRGAQVRDRSAPTPEIDAHTEERLRALGYR